MGRKTLTEKTVRSTTPPQAGRLEIFDTIVPGLCLRITEQGGRSFSLMYRVAGKLRRDTLGTYPRLGLAAAREKARSALDLVGQGIDPRAVAARQEAAAEQRRADTVEAVAERFVTLYARERRWGDLERILAREIVSQWGRRPISDITRRDALDLLASIKERAPVRANRVLAVMKLFMAWAVEHEYVTGSPVAAIRKPTRETKRERVLTEVELRAFWRGCEALGWPFGQMFRLLLLTAARRDEIADLRWAELDTDRGLAEIPAGRFKGNRPHVIPLAPAAKVIIDGLPRLDGSPLIFSRNGRTVVSDFSVAKRKLDELMLAELHKVTGDAVQLPGWTLHDLRRTARTEMSRIGISPDIAERVLGHAIGGVRSIYDRFDFLAEKRAALERWALHLGGIINPPDRDNVKAMLVGPAYVPSKAGHARRSDVTDEVSGAGYFAGGAEVAMTGELVGDEMEIGLGGTIWTGATITAAGAVYYRAGGGKAAGDCLIAYVDFGGSVGCMNGNFTLSRSKLLIRERAA